MAEGVKISELAAVTAVTGEEKLPLVQAGVTSSVTPNVLKTFIGSGGGGGGGGTALGWIIATDAPYNADPTGTNDSTSGLQAAINAAVNKTLYIPAGTYKVSLATQHALLVTNPIRIVMDPYATIKLATTASFAPGWGTDAGNVIGVLTVQSNDVFIEGNGTFDWNTTNASLTGFSSLIYVTSASPNVGGPYYTNVHIKDVRIRNSRGAGIWTENTNRLWVTYTDHAGGTGTDILILRSLIDLTDVYADDNYIDSSTIPPAVGVPIQLSINFTGSAGLATNRWSMCRNHIYAGLNTNVYYTATQIFSPSSPTEDGVWRNGHADGNIIEGAIGGGGPLGGAEAISAVNVSDSTISNNVSYNCYIGLEVAGQNNVVDGNTMDGSELYMQLGILMDGVNVGASVTGNTMRGFGGSNYQGIPFRGTKATFTGNTIRSRFGSGFDGTGLIIYVDSENAAVGDDTNTVVGNTFELSGESIAVDAYDSSNLNVWGNTITIEGTTTSPVRLNAPGTVGHATRDYISVHGNVCVGGALPVVNQVASADWGTNISLQTSRIDLASPGQTAFVAPAVNFNSANTDTTIPITLPTGFTHFRVNGVAISNASHSLTTATVGVFPAAAASGTAIVTSGTAVTVSTGTAGSANSLQSLTIATTTIMYNLASVFFRVQTAEGAAATADVTLTITPLP